MTQDQVNSNRERLNRAVDNLYELMLVNRESSPDVEKEILYQSDELLVQLTKIKKDGRTNVVDTPFDSQLLLAYGDIKVTTNENETLLSKLNRVLHLPKGASAKGIAREETGVITIANLGQ